MQRIIREFHNVSRQDVFRIVPIFDVHIGMGLCDEKRLRQVVNRVAEDKQCYWIGGGDYCEFINRSDPRFGLDNLAPWIKTRHMVDLAAAEKDRFLDYVKPIANRCLCLLMGNHEAVIRKYYERDIYSDIVTTIKQWGGMASDEKLGLGYYGWLLLKFNRSSKKKRAGASWIKFNLHHGHTGGKLAGGKASSIQRWTWTHAADIILFGHSHNTGTQVEAVEYVDSRGNIKQHKRFAAYCGNFVSSPKPGFDSYADRAGYPPMPMAGIEIELQPRAYDEDNRIRLTTKL